ncbi:hypothetical protein SKAU_G00079690 [Synaphobranchus kaupii]|uniref:Uncharacterized protein n=1 Tax=Synaphobranchus kaupii TaxID=118154 RepID=A0A9Q1FVE2_SYNKA|nr:hypothetical protein SKAU_G00079690 [Synaphobranchus kaupii]
MRSHPRLGRKSGLRSIIQAHGRGETRRTIMGFKEETAKRATWDMKDRAPYGTRAGGERLRTDHSGTSGGVLDPLPARLDSLPETRPPGSASEGSQMAAAGKFRLAPVGGPSNTM